ncbi:MAG: methyltransferase domain-containing protein, partial [Nitrospinota bacterium]|nr:methyltransferase domain-containing protein [Nitrospinota bacterium]
GEKPPAWFASGNFREAEVTWCASPGVFQVDLITRPGRRSRQPKNETDREGRGLFYAVDGRWPGGEPPRDLNPPAGWTYLIPAEALGRAEGLYMTAGPGEFLQPNPAENAALIETVLDFSRPAAGPGAAGGRALDLYCGVGNLSLPLALAGYGVLGVDSSPGGIRRARDNAKRNGVDGCEFKTLSAERALGGIRRGGGAFDLVVLDPPRAGCKKIVNSVADIRPGRILYVSCNPATLARDLKSLAQRGY